MILNLHLRGAKATFKLSAWLKGYFDRINEACSLN